jgi:hypothetical protein
MGFEEILRLLLEMIEARTVGQFALHNNSLP